ncbi:MAG: hypothetical protein ACREH6_14965 [Geminicoccaceae bacterium]
MTFRGFRYQSFDQTGPVGMRSMHRLASSSGVFEEEKREAIEAARCEGFAAGREEGIAAGREAALAQAEMQLASALPNALATLQSAVGDVKAIKEQCEHEALSLVRAALRQVLPILADKAFSHEVAALVSRVIANAPSPVVEIRSASHTREVVERLCGPVPADIRLVTDSALPEGGVVCAWSSGSARFDANALREAVLSILDRQMEIPGPDRGLDLIEAPAGALHHSHEES